jgi:hypothetical protein
MRALANGAGFRRWSIKIMVVYDANLRSSVERWSRDNKQSPFFRIEPVGRIEIVFIEQSKPLSSAQNETASVVPLDIVTASLANHLSSLIHSVMKHQIICGFDAVQLKLSAEAKQSEPRPKGRSMRFQRHSYIDPKCRMVVSHTDKMAAASFCRV